MRHWIRSGSACAVVLLAAGGAEVPMAADAVPGIRALEAIPFDSLHARPRLVSEVSELRPGGSAWLAVSFEIDDGWHLYWNGRNDSGLPPEITPELPDGYRMGPIEWPAPKRLVSAGEIIDHIYTGNVSLLFPVTVPATAKPEEPATLAFDVSWLACHDVCIPESHRVSLVLPVRAGAAEPSRSQAAELFDEARRKLPRPMAEAPDFIRVRWDEHGLMLRARGSKAVAFFPDTASVEFVDPITSLVARTDFLRLVPTEGQASGRVSGVLAATDPKSQKPVWYRIDVPATEAH